MATLNVIRRWALRENMSIREISRRTGMARNTVKKYLRSDETEPTYAKRVSSSKLDPFAEKLAIWLGMEATKSRKQRRNLKQIYTAISLKPETTVIGSKTVLQKLNPRRRRSRTYPQREHLVHTNRVGQDLMERLGQGSAQFNKLGKIPAVELKGVFGLARISFHECSERLIRNPSWPQKLPSAPTVFQFPKQRDVF